MNSPLEAPVTSLLPSGVHYVEVKKKTTGEKQKQIGETRIQKNQTCKLLYLQQINKHAHTVWKKYVK